LDGPTRVHKKDILAANLCASRQQQIIDALATTIPGIGAYGLPIEPATGITSSPAGINVAVGSTGVAAFPSGTQIMLSVSRGRDAVWSAACSSGANKAKTCRFTPTTNITVNANVQQGM